MAEPGKKRRNDTELNQDNWREESAAGDDGPQAGTGEFERAPPEELAKRRKIVVQRGPNGQALPKGANPFAGVSVKASAPAAAEPARDAAAASTSAPPTADADSRPPESAHAQPAGNGAESAAPPAAADAATDGAAAEARDAATAAPAATGFGSLSVPGGAFQFGGSFKGAGNGAGGDAGTTSVFGSGFGGFAAGGFSGGSIFSAAPAKADAAEGAAGTVPLFAAQRQDPQTDDAGKSGLLPNERPVTGEEDEVVLFSSDASLFVFGADKAWKERGKGEVRVNKLPDGQARIVMRQKGNYRLMLNANLFPEMSVQVMEGGRGVTFNCVNAVLAEDVQPLSVPATVGSETVPASIAPAAEPTEPAEAAKAVEPEAAAAADKDGAAAAAEPKASAAAAGAAGGPGDASAGASASMAGMVLHALRLRPAENQEAFLRVMNACKDGSAPVAAHSDAWVPPF